jgi:hypothetical protein
MMWATHTAFHILPATQAYAILDEYLLGGEVLETSQAVMLARMHEFDKLIER